MAEIPVRMMAQGPGPVGSAEIFLSQVLLGLTLPAHTSYFLLKVFSLRN